MIRPLIAALGLALLTLIGVGWAYQNRPPWTLNVGEPEHERLYNSF